MCWLIADSDKVATSIIRDGDVGKIEANSITTKHRRDSVDLPEVSKWKHVAAGRRSRGGRERSDKGLVISKSLPRMQSTDPQRKDLPPAPACAESPDIAVQGEKLKRPEVIPTCSGRSHSRCR